MKHILTLIVILITSSAFSQKLGTKKTITLKLTSYECVDNCYISFKDIEKGSEYDFHNIDNTTNDNNLIKKIEDVKEDAKDEIIHVRVEELYRGKKWNEKLEGILKIITA